MKEFYSPVPSPEEQRERYSRTPEEVFQEVLDMGVDQVVRDLYPKLALDEENKEQHIAGLIILQVADGIYRTKSSSETEKVFTDDNWKKITKLIEAEVHELEKDRKSIVAEYENKVDERNFKEKERNAQQKNARQ